MNSSRLTWLIVLLIATFGISQLFWGQRLEANNGLGWDGYTYAKICEGGIHSPAINHYLFFRIAPSLLLHSIYQIAGISFSPENIRLGFMWLNILCLMLSARMAGGLFSQFSLSLPHQLLGYLLLFLNFFALRFSFYYPVLTDVPGFTLGIALLYFYLKDEKMNIWLTGLLAAFTWPPVALTAIPMLLFAYKPLPFQDVSSRHRLWLMSGTALISMGIIYYVWQVIQTREYIAFALPVDRKWLIFSSCCLILSIFPAGLLFRNARLYSIRNINWRQAVLVVSLIAIPALLYRIIQPPVAQELSGFAYLLKAHWFFSLSKPFISIVSHFSYFGILIPLLILFWPSFTRFVSSMGIGLPMALFINIMMFAPKSESRVLVNLFGTLAILFTLFAAQLRIKGLPLTIIIGIQVLISKCWFSLNFTNITTAYFRSDGLIAWPFQKFYMHLGIYMTPQIWAILLLCLLFSLTLLLFVFFTPRWDKEKIVSHSITENGK